MLYNVQCLEQRKTWETNYTVDDLVSGDCYEGVERVVCKSPVMGFAQREMVLFRQTKCLPAFEYPYVTYCRSTDCMDHTYPPGNKKTVRASSTFCGDIFWPGPEPFTTRLVVCTDSNPGGNIPKWAVDAVIDKVPQQITSALGKQCAKFIKEKGYSKDDPDLQERLKKLVESLNVSPGRMSTVSV